MTNGTKYAAYSAKSAQLHGTAIYLMEDGSKQHVCCIGNKPDLPSFQWDDKVLLGKVKHWLRDGREGSQVDYTL